MSLHSYLHSVRQGKTLGLSKYHGFQHRLIFFYKIVKDYFQSKSPLLLQISSF